MDLTGFRNHMKDESGLVGFSRALGSSLPRPAGLFSASSVLIKMSSASTLPCSISSSFSSWAYIGHQPLVLFCLNRFMVGTDPSVFNIPRLHCLAVLAPRGNLLRSSMMEPRKSSLENESASQTWSESRGGTLVMLSSQENMLSFLLITIFSSAARYSKGKTNRQLKLPSPVRDL